MNFSDRLTPAQIKLVLDALNIRWREYYKPDNKGWVNVPDERFNSDLSVNISHGGWVDQYFSDHPEPICEGVPVRGDIVTLASLLTEGLKDPKSGIEFIKEVCKIKDGTSPPDVPEGFHFANDWLACADATFVRLPMEILSSDLSSTEKVVWAAIFSRCNRGIYSHPGIRQIAKDTGLSKSTVQSATAKLAEYGLLIEKFRGKDIPYDRFPIVASTEKINQAIREKNRPDSERNKSAVPNTSTGVSAITDRGVLNIGTGVSAITDKIRTIQLEPYNYNQMLKGKIKDLPSPPDGYFEKFLFVQRRFSIKYYNLTSNQH